MNLNEMKAKRGEIADKMKAMVNSIEGNFTEDQNIEFKKLNDDFNSVDAQINCIEQADNAQEISNQPANAQRPNPTKSVDRNVPVNSTAEYKDEFQKFLDSKGSISNELSVGSDPKGGFLIPEDWATELIREVNDQVVMREVSSVLTLAHDRNYPGIVDDGDAGYIVEGAAYPETDITLDNKVIGAHKQGRIIKVSDELDQDAAYNLPAEIKMSFGMTFGNNQEDKFTNGSGTDEPRGFLLDAMAGPTSLAVAAIGYDDMINLKYSLKKSYRTNGAWMMNSNTVRDLRKLKSTDGVPLWQPSLQAGEPEMFDGSPIRVNEQMPDVATGETPVAFGDFRFYKIVDRLGIQLLILKELYAGNGKIGMRFTARNDGRLMLPEAVKKMPIQ